jgi:PAS domain S-box-containing protein
MIEPPDPAAMTGAASSRGSLAAAHLAAIVESAADGIISKQLDGTIATWNAAAERIFGYSAAEMVGASVYVLVPPELHDEERGILERISRGQRVERYETTRLRKDGTRLTIELTISPVRGPSGQIIGAVSIKRDVTDRKRDAQALARLAAIVASADDAILAKTLDGTVIEWNAAAERIFGFTADEIVGSSVTRLVPEALHAEERDILRRVAAGAHVEHYETVRRHKNGAEIPISLTISPIVDSHGVITAASSIMRDITDQRHTQAALRQAAKLEAIGRLAGGLAHDFNNQLYALSGFAHFVARDPGLSASSRQDLLQVQQAGERMAAMTRQLLAFARQQVLSPEVLDLNAAVTDAQPLLQRLIGSNIGIQLSCSGGPKWVRVDRSQLVQVVMNLVINARDAMSDAGNVAIRTETLEVSPGQLTDRLGVPMEPGAYAELAVSDPGAGIGPDEIPRIFEPFYTTKAGGGGTGLGLATVDGIVSQSGGRILVESVLGRGTTVRVFFPLKAEPPAVTPPAATPDAGRPPNARLLVVDDEPQVRRVVVRTLRDQGYEVIEASDAATALQCFDALGGAVDLAITDLVMPGMSGRALANELIRRRPELPVIWMSGHPSELDPRDETADYSFLQKPIASDALLATVRSTLERKVSRP